MASRVSHTTINCGNAYELSEWWKTVIDYVDVDGDPNEAGHEQCMILDRSGNHRLLFIEVDELQQPVGRIHFDLAPTDRRRDEEIERVLALGATEVADRRHADGSGWMVLADPAGNQFCIVRSDEERGSSQASNRRRMTRPADPGTGLPPHADLPIQLGRYGTPPSDTSLPGWEQKREEARRQGQRHSGWICIGVDDTQTTESPIRPAPGIAPPPAPLLLGRHPAQGSLRSLTQGFATDSGRSAVAGCNEMLASGTVTGARYRPRQ